MSFDSTFFLNNIIMISIAIYTSIVCKNKEAFKGDAKVNLVKPSASKKKQTPLGPASPHSALPPPNVPISPMFKEDDTLQEVKSLKPDNTKLRKGKK